MHRKIIVLGGGFAGIEAAIKLRELRYEVTLISNRDYMFIYPVSIWIPLGKRSFQDTQIMLDELAKKHGFEVVIDNITKIEASKNQLVSANKTYQYDTLFLAPGMSKVQMPGLEHTYSICGKPEVSLQIKDRLDAIIARGNGTIAVGFGGNPKDTTGSAVRGGPAFELLFNISNLLKEKGLTDKIALTFFAPMEAPGKRMGDQAVKGMDAYYDRYHVKTRFGKKIKQFTAESIIFEDDSVLLSDLTLFIPGGNGMPLLIDSDLPTDVTGFVKIAETCQVEGFENVYAMGDATALKNYPWAAKQGHVAEVMADVSVYNFDHILRGKPERKSYWDRLHIICVMDSGDGAAFVMRTEKNEFMLPMPLVGHWLKKGWGWYYKNTKLKKMFRIPGM